MLPSVAREGSWKRSRRFVGGIPVFPQFFLTELPPVPAEDGGVVPLVPAPVLLGLMVPEAAAALASWAMLAAVSSGFSSEVSLAEVPLRPFLFFAGGAGVLKVPCGNNSNLRRSSLPGDSWGFTYIVRRVLLASAAASGRTAPTRTTRRSSTSAGRRAGVPRGTTRVPRVACALASLGLLALRRGFPLWARADVLVGLGKK